MVDLHAFMPVQQLSGVVHGVHSQADKVTAQQAVEVHRKELTLHQAKGVSSHLRHQNKTCRNKQKKSERALNIQQPRLLRCCSPTGNEGDPDLHPPGEGEHQQVENFDQVCGFPLGCHGVILKQQKKSAVTVEILTSVMQRG